MTSSIQEKAQRLHDLACKMFGVHASNPALRGLGIPGAGLSGVQAANDIIAYIAGAESERRGRASVSRCKAARVNVRAGQSNVLTRLKAVRVRRIQQVDVKEASV